MSTVVLDLDGVVYRGETAVPGAPEALAILDRDHRVVLATNNSGKTRQQVLEKVMRTTGVELTEGQVVTSATAAGSIADAVPTAVVGGGGIQEALNDREIPIVDFDACSQVVSGIDPAFSYDRLRSASLAIRRGARWIATNLDPTLPVEGTYWPGSGSLQAAIATASESDPEVAGKPHTPMVELVEARAGDGPIVMVGDRPDTDLALARAGGWVSVLALTGVTGTPDEVPTSLTPDHVVADLGRVPDLLDSLVP